MLGKLHGYVCVQYAHTGTHCVPSLCLQEVMQDPVIASDGHTYERAAIMEWFARKDTSPMTNQRVSGLFTLTYPVTNMCSSTLRNVAFAQLP